MLYGEADSLAFTATSKFLLVLKLDDTELDQAIMPDRPPITPAALGTMAIRTYRLRLIGGLLACRRKT